MSGLVIFKDASNDSSLFSLTFLTPIPPSLMGSETMSRSDSLNSHPKSAGRNKLSIALSMGDVHDCPLKICIGLFMLFCMQVASKGSVGL